MKDRMKKIMSDVEKLIDKLDAAGIEGSISYLECAIENIESAIEEYDLYQSSGDEDED